MGATTCKEKDIDSQTLLEKKFVLLTKDIQSGKTQIMVDQIMHDFQKDRLFIIFCSNSTLTTTQTTERIIQGFNELTTKKKEIGDLSKVILILSSQQAALKCKKKENEYLILRSSVNKQQQDTILEEAKFNVILCCSHPKKFQQIIYVIKTNQWQYRDIYIWADEIHDKWSSYFEYFTALANFNIVKRIYGVTATPAPLFEKNWNKSTQINIMHVSEPHDANRYVGIDDITFIPYDLKELDKELIAPDDYERTGCAELYLNTLFIKQQLNFKSGDFILVPAWQKCVQNALRKVLRKYAHVIVYNSSSDFPKLYFKKTAYETKDAEKGISISNFKYAPTLGDGMASVIQEKIIDKEPIALIGQGCIGQGVTCCDFKSNLFITKLIVVPATSKKSKGKDRISALDVQVIGRIFGNFKQEKGWNGCEFYAPFSFISTIKDYIAKSRISWYAYKINKTKLCYKDYLNDYREILYGYDAAK